MWLCTSLHSHSILWLCLGGLAIKVPLQSPVTLTMASQTNIFSTPLSMWTHGGRKPPYFSIASSNNCNTVSARLLGLHLKNIYPSRKCIDAQPTSILSVNGGHPGARGSLAKGHYRLCGILQLSTFKAEFWGSSLTKHSLILLRWIQYPRDFM